MDIILNNSKIFDFNENTSLPQIKQRIESDLGLHSNDYYILQNGKLLSATIPLSSRKLYLIPRILGGKGGFGSMLRAIGAQIEKTTNREACRDLSGRRLRDINEEKRLKNWITQQAEREQEAAKRKKKKLEKLCEQPKHEFKDDEYDKSRLALPEQVEDAVTQGLKASCSTKRKGEASEAQEVKNKKAKLWFDEADLSVSDDSSEDEPDKEEENKNLDPKEEADDTDINLEKSVVVQN